MDSSKEAIIISPLTSFGEVRVAQPVPRVQLDAVYGIRDITDTQSLTDGVTGSISISDGTGQLYSVNTGVAANGYAILKSKRAVRYRPGTGILFRYTALYSAPKANSSIRAGAYSNGTELSFGYVGTQFGILYRTAARQEIQRLTVATAATGNETLTVTLNGVAKTVAVTSGTKKHNAFQVASTVFPGWEVSHNGETVTFISNLIGAKAGAFSIASTGAMAGTFSELVAGVSTSTTTDTFIPQTEWNNLRLLGDQPDPFILDPTKGNVFAIKIQYLGFGGIQFLVENPSSASFVVVHTIKYSNKNIASSLDYPIFKMGFIAENLGNTSDVYVRSASAAGFIEGLIEKFRNTLSMKNSKAGIGTTSTNILSIRNRGEFASRINLTEVFPLILECAADASKNCELRLVLNPTLGGEPDWTYISQGISTIEYDIAGTTVTGGLDLFSSVIAKIDSRSVNLKDLDIHLDRNDVLTIAMKATTSTVDTSVSISWSED
jgi:hypothetical protein